MGDDKLCVYELVTGMILTSYSEDFNKIRMLFNLLDFDNNQGLDLDEFILLVTFILEAWGRLTLTQYESREQFEKVARAIFSVRDGRITITEIAAWLEINKPFTMLLKTMNPQMPVVEKITTFLPLKRPKEHFCELT